MSRIAICGLLALALVGWGGSLGAQTPGGPAPAGPAASGGAVAPGGPSSGAAPSPPPGQSFWDILAASGLVGLVIGLLSIAAVALVIEHAMTLRRGVLMPPGLADDVRHLLAAGEVATARRRCQEQPSFLAFVLAAAMGEAEGGWAAVEKAAEDAAADQSARLFRKIEYLSVIGNIAPMLGLLGTVIGMVYAFREVADTQGAARAADLAEGIYLALVTTIEGLVVAIPALAAFAIFRNRVDQFVAEAAYVARHALAPLKRRRGAAPGKAPSAPPPVGGSL
ncbi:MAG: MotA/TolQ/ExbB proton channel family protein [Pirellulales bacterium]|nr:MotA/TolQ/ExbB proton channel family protein [Pirellulales bacterium]